MPTVDSYIIQRSLTGTDNWISVGTVSGATTTFSDTGLDLDTTYYYRVIAQNDEGVSAPSNVANATTASGAFDPNSIADLVSWLDASVLSSMTDSSDNPVTTNLDTFGTWREQLADTPAAFKWLGSTAGFQWHENRNGYPAVTITAAPMPNSRDASNAWVDIVSGGEQTLFAVASSDLANNYVTVISTSETTISSRFGGAFTAINRRTPGNGNMSTAFVQNTAGSFFNPPTFPSPNNTSDTRAVAVRLSQANNQARNWLNGIASPTYATSGTLWQADGRSVLGFAGIGGNVIGNLYIHETLVYDRALSDAEVDEVNDYLTVKYGI